ncbi:lateral signaling target protein 2 homolog isoform X2 [Panonychus citri]|uniref:lateral signaling target protein 2 homolog isoform X2 n=1 Tax=Panonychus citri TaxID=50023 RepID=UPI0023077C05|nr:lateral signaling target protein 2 homolog isoform X2 [Panonychus citri]
MMHPHSSHHTNNGNHSNHHHLHVNHHLPFHRNNKHHHCQEDLFQSYTIFSSCDEDDSSSIIDDVKPLPSLTMSNRLMITQDLKMSEIRSQLISHKLLLTNLIKVNESEVRNLIKSTKQRIKQDDLLDEPGQTYLDKILEKSRNSRISSKFPQNVMSIKKGICCFEDNLCKCDKPSLPFSRHCQRHILYNVDQLLFVRCTAKDSETSAQCCNPSLDVFRDEPLCNHHLHKKSLISPCIQPEEDNLKANNLLNVGPVSGKGKLLSGPGRHGKRTKKRRKLTGGKGIPGSIDNVDSSSLFSQDSTDSHFVNTNNCDTSKIHLSAIKTEPNDITTSTSLSIATVQPNQQQQSSILSTIPQAMSLQINRHHLHHQPIQPQPQIASQPQPLQHLPTSTVASSHLSNGRGAHGNLSTIPNAALLIRGDQTSVAQTLTSSVPVVLPGNGIIPGHLGGCVTSLAQSDEALVASLVAELPPLCAENGPEPEPPGFVDADLTEVLKIPDDAFNDLFVDNLKNGDIPSKEESEALEQALAAVSKNVQYLSVAAAAVGGSSRSSVNNLPREGVTSVTPTTVINGDSNYYSHQTQHHNHNHNHHNHHHHHHHQHHHHHGRSITNATSLNLNENDILGLANNILTSLTTEQQQQLNGLIDGALASGSLTSPTIKSALASLSSLPQESESCEAHL